MRRRKQRQKWLLAGLAPLAAGAVWWVRREVSRRRAPGRARYFPEMQIPVTAQKKQRGRTAEPRRGTAKVYATPAEPAQRTGDADQQPRGKFPWLLALVPLLILAVFTVLALLGQPEVRAQAVQVPGGDPESGRQALRSWGCGSCHTIPGVAGAYGKVGPRLNQMAEQTYIAGMLPNTPENLIRWIMEPQEIQPGNAMPDMGVSEGMARNIAAYLYSIR